MSYDFVSIDQNTNTLWDTIPKLNALQKAGLHTVHCVEDVDVAFTHHGARPDQSDSDLTLARERVYKGGVSDWGATLFYTTFMGRNMRDVTEFEAYTGWRTKALCKRLGCTVPDLYRDYADSDNWQLIGSSYLQNTSQHRVIGDLSIAEVKPFLSELLDLAEEDLLCTFPDPAARKRIKDWFANEKSLCERLANSVQTMTDFYIGWAREKVGDRIGLTTTSGLLRKDAYMQNTSRLLQAFITDYDTMVDLYNQAVSETGVGLNKLHKKQGELPFFMIWYDEGRQFRTPVFWTGQAIETDKKAWRPGVDGQLPWDEWHNDGVVCLPGKALLLVLQVRMGAEGLSLALPYQGSTYMPSAFRFQQLVMPYLDTDGTTAVKPVYRVKFNFFEYWKDTDVTTTVRLPDWAVPAFSQAEIPANELADSIARARQRVDAILRALQSDESRDDQIHQLFPELTERKQHLESKRRELARNPETREQSKGMWEEVKQLETELMTKLVEEVSRCLHVRDLDYYNSRGALLPWSVAMAGETHYWRMIEQAEIYQETLDNS